VVLAVMMVVVVQSAEAIPTILQWGRKTLYYGLTDGNGITKTYYGCDPYYQAEGCTFRDVIVGPSLPPKDGYFVNLTPSFDPNDPNKNPFRDLDPTIYITLLNPIAIKTDVFTFSENIVLDQKISESMGVTSQVIVLKGVYPVDYKASVYGTIRAKVMLQAIPPNINCSLVQDGNFANVTAPGSNISSTSTPWKPGILSPQWTPADGCDGVGGYALMWGNKVVGESVIQTLGGGGFVKGQRYNLSLCARLRPSPNLLTPNHVRVRVIAYNGTAPHRGTSPTSKIIYESPDITSTSWQNFSSCSWIADKNYTNIEILPVNNSSLNDGRYVSWSDIDNIKICQVNACDGLDFSNLSRPKYSRQMLLQSRFEFTKLYFKP
jgi:hypothetical protein